MIEFGSDKYLEFSGQSTDRTTSTSFMLMSIANGFIQRYKSDFVEIIQRQWVDMSKSFKVTHSGLHKLCYPTIRDRSTWSEFGAHGEHGDVFLFSNLGAL